MMQLVVTATVTDAEGEKATATVTVDVLGPAPVAAVEPARM